MLTWWFRLVGLLYLLAFVAAAVAKAPIEAEGPAGTLARAAAGDPLARFVVNTWVTFGLYMGAVGAALLLASRRAGASAALVPAVILLELAGMLSDVFKIARGQPAAGSAPPSP